MTRLRLALAVVAGYVLIAQLVGNFYPFSRFDMYSRPASSGSRIIARVGGRVEEVDGWVAWSCEGEFDPQPERCGSYATTDPVEHEVIGWLRAHAGEGTVPLDLIRRIRRFPGGAPGEVEDCLLQHCRAVRQVTR